MDPKGYAFGGVEGRSLRLASFTRLPWVAVVPGLHERCQIELMVGEPDQHLGVRQAAGDYGIVGEPDQANALAIGFALAKQSIWLASRGLHLFRSAV
jgi:hypothetical protein